MTPQLGLSRRNWLARTAFVALTTLALTNAMLLRGNGAELAEQAHSLKQVPADAAFYSASLRFKEQWHAFLGSKAYAKLMEIPFVQIAKMQVSFQWQQSEEPHVAKVREYVQSPAGQDAVAILREMFSDEGFMYAGSDFAESIKLFMDLNSLRRPFIKAEGTTGEDESNKEKNPTEANVNRILDVLEKHADTFKLPTMVMGFRIKDQARAKREVDEVHSQLRNLLDESAPEIASHLQRNQIAGHEFLTLLLDGTMLPWDKIHEEAKQLDDQQFDKLKGFISKQKLAVALGVTDEFVILSISDSTDHLEKMGRGPVLAEAPAIKWLQKHAGERLVAIQYVSKAFAKNLGSPKRTIDDIARAIEDGLTQAKISEEHRKEIEGDIRKLDLARYMPEPGDTAGVAFLTSRGYESFQYSDSKRPMMDSSRPLSILSHVGGSPMVVIASRSKQNVEDYKQIVAWLTQTTEHIEKIAQEKADADDWAKYQEIRKRAIALLERLDKANREHLYPALADGQGAIVFDVEAKSKKWFKKMPESPKPLPMFELAFAASVSDAEHLRQGISEYIDVAVEAYKLVKEYNPKEMPELKMPKAEVSEISGGGKMYTYPLPKKWDVDPQVAVNAGLTDKFVAVSIMPKTTERMLHDIAPDLDTSLKLDRPAAMVAHVEFAKFINALRPWIDYGVDVATGKLKVQKNKDGDDEDKPAEQNPVALKMGFVVPQVQQFLEVMTTLRSFSAISYEDDRLWITHSETHIQDLK
jgi:hypothetical protein